MLKKILSYIFHDGVADIIQTLLMDRENRKRCHRSFFFHSVRPDLRVRLQPRQPEPFSLLQSAVKPEKSLEKRDLLLRGKEICAVAFKNMRSA